MPGKIAPVETLARVQELIDGGTSARAAAKILAAEGVPAVGPRRAWHHENVGWCLDEIDRRAGAVATWGLTPQLRARLAAQGQEIEDIISAVMRRLGERAQAAVEAAMETIQRAADRQAAAVRWRVGHLWTWFVLGGLCVCLGLASVGWGIGDALAGRITSAAEELAGLTLAIEEQQETVRLLGEKTGGISVVERADSFRLRWSAGSEPQQRKRGGWEVVVKK